MLVSDNGCPKIALNTPLLDASLKTPSFLISFQSSQLTLYRQSAPPPPLITLYFEAWMAACKFQLPSARKGAVEPIAVRHHYQYHSRHFTANSLSDSKKHLPWNNSVLTYPSNTISEYSSQHTSPSQQEESKRVLPASSRSIPPSSLANGNFSTASDWFF